MAKKSLIVKSTNVAYRLDDRSSNDSKETFWKKVSPKITLNIFTVIPPTNIKKFGIFKEGEKKMLRPPNSHFV